MRIKQKKNNQKVIIISCTLALFLIAASLIYFNIEKTANNEGPAATSTETKSESTPHKTPNTSGSISTSKDSPGDKNPVPTLSPSVTPQKPTGTFVSNHHPNLGNSPAPSAMNSTCTTTAGSSCTITFTKGETTLSLSSKQADVNGSVSWSWNLHDINLTEGDWTVSAIATNGDKSSTTTDPMLLEVKS